MISSHARLSPDWVVLGTLTGLPDETVTHMVLASDTLSEAELRAELEVDRTFLPWPHDRLTTTTTYVLTTTMRSMVIVYGSSYQDCLRTLFTQWGPAEPAERAGSARSALGEAAAAGVPAAGAAAAGPGPASPALPPGGPTTSG